MYQLNIANDHDYKVYELTDPQIGSWLKVVPERGGIITELGVKGNEALFLNKETLYNPEKNIRGGIPILFPISGQLDGGKYEWNGKEYEMKNHGFARNLPWEVLSTKTEENRALIILQLKSNQETKKEFPFAFELNFTYSISEKGVLIEQQYTNQSSSPMPMYPGFHPYFNTAAKKLTYKTDAKTYLDYNDMEVREINGPLDLSDKKESLVLLDPEKREISFELPDWKKTVIMRYGNEFKYVVLWTEKGQNFVCVEPWMAETNELNRKQELVMVQPGETLETTLSILVD